MKSDKRKNYNSIQDDLVYFASKIINAIGATDALSFEAPVTSDLRNNRFTSMYLALMLKVLIRRFLESENWT